MEKKIPHKTKEQSTPGRPSASSGQHQNLLGLVLPPGQLVAGNNLLEMFQQTLEVDLVQILFPF